MGKRYSQERYDEMLKILPSIEGISTSQLKARRGWNTYSSNTILKEMVIKGDAEVYQVGRTCFYKRTAK